MKVMRKNMTIKVVNQDDKYDYYIYPSVSVVDATTIKKYFGTKGAGRAAFFRDNCDTLALEVYKYDKMEGQFVERIDNGNKK